MRDHGEEASMLYGLLERFSGSPVLVTFNGKSFDWPLLQTRFQMRRLGIPRELPAHLDFLHPARQFWRLCFDSVALAQLERHVLGLDRGQDIPSEAIPRRYFDFLRGSPPEEMAEVFRHNEMDLCGLALLALHITRILAEPEKWAGRAEELYGVSRLLQRRGEDRLARQIYGKALEAGLPRKVEPVAQRELALLAKRERDFELSNSLWEKLLRDPAEGLKAYEQLAIYYERYARLPQKAAALSREALVSLQDALHTGRMSSRQYMQWHGSFQHRLARLTAKLAE
jgi:tetratricopeptide (TPR) repeat protein